MTYTDIWNYIVMQYKKNYNAQEAVVQQEWEQYFSELFNYRRLFKEIDPHRTIHIGSGQRTIPDIIINVDGQDLFDVELKQYNMQFSAEMEHQLKSYMDLLHISVGVLVCQKIYLYVYEYEQSKLKRMEIAFTKDNPDGIKFVELFQKGCFGVDKVAKFIDSQAQFCANVEKIQSEISKDLILSLLEEHFKKQYTTNEVTIAMGNINLYVKTKSEAPIESQDDEKTITVNEQNPKKLFAEHTKHILADYDLHKKLQFSKSSPNSYIQFQTKEMSAILPNMSRKGSWGYGVKYLFMLCV